MRYSTSTGLRYMPKLNLVWYINYLSASQIKYEAVGHTDPAHLVGIASEPHTKANSGWF